MAQFMNAPQLLNAAGLFMQMKSENEKRPLDQQVNDSVLRKVAQERTREMAAKAKPNRNTVDENKAREIADMFSEMEPMQRMEPLQPMQPDMPSAPAMEEIAPMDAMDAVDFGPMENMYAGATEDEILMGQAAMDPEPMKAVVGKGVESMSGQELAAKSEYFAAQREFNKNQIALQKDPKVRQSMVESMNEMGNMEGEINAELARRQSSSNPAAMGTALAEFERSIY